MDIQRYNRLGTVFFVCATVKGGRFSRPIVPVLCLFAAYAATYLWAAFRRKDFGLVRAVLIVAAAAAFVNADYLYQKQMRAYSDAFSNYSSGRSERAASARGKSSRSGSRSSGGGRRRR